VIVVQLSGGLGNQMFQYATGRALAARHGTQLVLDSSWIAGSVGGSVTLRIHPKAYADRGISNPIVVSFSFSRGFGANLKDVAAGSVTLLDESFRPAVYPD